MSDDTTPDGEQATADLAEQSPLDPSECPHSLRMEVWDGDEYVGTSCVHCEADL